MRIGIDAHVIGKNIGGVERYVEKVVELVPDLCPQHQFVVFISRRARSRFLSDSRRNVQFVTLPVSDPVVQRSVLLPWFIRVHDLDVLHVQRIAPWLSGHCRIVLTVHDLIPIKYPHSYRGWRDRLIRLLTPNSIARAHLILCPTEVMCEEVSLYYPTATTSKRPYYCGVDSHRFTGRRLEGSRNTLERYNIDRPFIFSPGGIEERKNIETIIEAIAQIEASTRPLLILSGKIRDTAYFGRLQKLARNLAISEDIRYLGFVAEDDLIELYGRANVYITASRDEGFNLPPLEALACGTSVICSDIPVHRELYEGAVTFFPTDRPDLLAQAIREPDGRDLRAKAEAAKAIIDRWSWTAMARKMASYFDELSSREI